MKKNGKRYLAIVCTLALLVAGMAVGTTTVTAEDTSSLLWKMFPPAMYEGDVLIRPRAGSTISSSYAQCDVQLPNTVAFETLSLYVKMTVNQAAADALNLGGSLEIANQTMDKSEIHWNVNSVEWKAGLNEFYFPFNAAGASAGNTGPFDITKPIKWFRLYTSPGKAVLATDGEVIYHEISIVDTTEGGMTFGEDETYLQLSQPLSGTPNTIEVSVKVDPETVLTASMYPIFSNVGSADQQPVALAMTNTGKLKVTWGTTVFEVNHDLRTGDWVDIALVRDTAANAFYVYLDGVSKTTRSAAGTLDIQPTTAHCIASDGTGTVFVGGIADLRVWSTARTATQIKENRIPKKGNRENGLTGQEPGLLGSWYLFGSSNYVLSTAPDISRYENHAKFCGPRAEDWLTYDKSQYAFLYDQDGNEDYYSIVFIPDIQNLVTGQYTEEWLTMAQWIGDHVESENIVQVMGAGDSTWTDSLAQWNIAKSGFERFAHKVSWNNAPGNHDYQGSCGPVNGVTITQRDSRNYQTYFGETYLKATASADTYMGCFEDPYGLSTTENSYYCFGVNGVRWMILQLEYHPRQHVMDWANGILEQHPQYNVILTTHGFLSGSGGYCTEWMSYIDGDPNVGGYLGSTTQPIWSELAAKHDNVKMILCGHATNDDGTVVYRSDVNDAGHAVPQLMINAQNMDAKDDGSASYFVGAPLGMLGILRFSADGTQVAVQYYSPVHEASYGVESNAIAFSLTTQPATDCTHSSEKTVTAVAATCKKPGTAHVLCKECGEYLRSKDIPQRTEHLWDDGEVTQKPTADTEGVMTYTCDSCGDTKTEPLDPTGMLGDVNGSKKVDSTDARLVLQYAVKKIPGSSLELKVADVSGDGKVDSTDARLILQYAVKKIPDFPATSEK